MDKTYKLELNSNEMCRVCLARSCSLTNLFCNEIVDGDIMAMPDIFETVTEIKICENDGFPQKICMNCSSKLIQFYILKEKCKKSIKLLQKILNLPDPNESAVMLSQPKSVETQTEEKVIIDASIQTSPVKLSTKLDKNTNVNKSSKKRKSQNYCAEENLFECTESNPTDSLQATNEITEMKYDENSEIDIIEIIEEMSDNENMTEIIYLPNHNDIEIGNEPDEDNKVVCINTALLQTTAANQMDANATEKSGKHKITMADKHTLKCDYCKKNFNNSDEFKTHMNDHLEILPIILTSTNFFRCSQCRLVFPSAEHLLNHFDNTELCTEIKNANSDDNCIDYQYLSDPITENMHYSRMFSCYKYEENVYACELCDDTFENILHFVEHFNDLHLINNETCEELYAETLHLNHYCGMCNKSCLNLKDIMFHVYFHQTIFFCPFLDCSNCYMKFPFLNRHITREHSINTEYTCPHCNYVAPDYISFKLHSRKICTERKFKCSYCEKAFLRKNTQLMHERVHINDKKFKCKICDKSFIQSNDLKNHIRTHTDERPFQCALCDKSFRTLSNRTDHLATHVDDKKFKCDICKKTFKSARILNGHQRLHAERSFPCEICGKMFNRRYHVTVHMKTHLKQKPKPNEVIMETSTAVQLDK